MSGANQYPLSNRYPMLIRDPIPLRYPLSKQYPILIRWVSQKRDDTNSPNPGRPGWLRTATLMLNRPFMLRYGMRALPGPMETAR